MEKIALKIHQRPGRKLRKIDFAESRENIPAEMLAIGAFIAFAKTMSRSIREPFALAAQQQPVDQKPFFPDVDFAAIALSFQSKLNGHCFFQEIECCFNSNASNLRKRGHFL